MEIEYILVWLIVAFAVGFVWKKLSLSFVSGVVWSLVLSPVVSLIIAYVWYSAKKKKNPA